MCCTLSSYKNDFTIGLSFMAKLPTLDYWICGRYIHRLPNSIASFLRFASEIEKSPVVALNNTVL